MFEDARADIEDAGRPCGIRSAISCAPLRCAFLFTHPLVLRALGPAAALVSSERAGMAACAQLRLTALLPRDLRELEPLTPRVQPRFFRRADRRRSNRPARPRYRVGMLTGCVQDLVYPHVNRDTVDVLLANGCEVITPRGAILLRLAARAQRRTGAGARHGAEEYRRHGARRRIAGKAGRDHHQRRRLRLAPQALRPTCWSDDPRYAERARLWSRKVKDIHEWLVEIGMHAPATSRQAHLRLPVTYHEACHLCHGQKITQQPRAILQAIPGLKLVELPEATWCCGSAGIYNITQPEMSANCCAASWEISRRPARSIVATANPGCSVQLEAGARASGQPAGDRAPDYAPGARPPREPSNRDPRSAVTRRCPIAASFFARSHRGCTAIRRKELIPYALFRRATQRPCTEAEATLL